MCRTESKTDTVLEAFSAIGSPARLIGRLPLFTRHVWNGFSSPWPHTPYGGVRFGKRYKWRIWLLLDIHELEFLENLINEGSDKELAALQQGHLTAFQMVAIIVCDLQNHLTSPNRIF